MPLTQFSPPSFTFGTFRIVVHCCWEIMSRLTISDADLKNLEGKVVVLTGGSSGIGLETAKKFLQVGAKVVNGDLNPPPSESKDDNLSFVPLDVTSWEQLSAFFQKAVEIHGRIDHVFANAGVGPTTNYLDEHFDKDGKLLEPSFRTLDVNLRAVINTTHLALHHMRKQQTSGSIVIAASASSFQQFSPVDYTISKHGVLGLMRGLAPITYPHLPIRINVVAPDWTVTNIIEPTFVKSVADLGGFTQPAEVVARSVGLLMADESRHAQMIYSQNGQFKELEGDLLGRVKEFCEKGPTLNETFVNHYNAGNH